MNEELYRERMEGAAIVENARMLEVSLERGKSSRGVFPRKLLAAGRVLFQRGSLTARDLACILKIPQPRALVLLYRLQKAGLATSEVHSDAGVRIFSACKTGD
jgi:DNA-binding MarR family transcriptional regulator